MIKQVSLSQVFNRSYNRTFSQCDSSQGYQWSMQEHKTKELVCKENHVVLQRSQKSPTIWTLSYVENYIEDNKHWR